MPPNQSSTATTSSAADSTAAALFHPRHGAITILQQTIGVEQAVDCLRLIVPAVESSSQNSDRCNNNNNGNTALERVCAVLPVSARLVLEWIAAEVRKESSGLGLTEQRTPTSPTADGRMNISLDSRQHSSSFLPLLRDYCECAPRSWWNDASGAGDTSRLLQGVADSTSVNRPSEETEVREQTEPQRPADALGALDRFVVPTRPLNEEELYLEPRKTLPIGLVTALLPHQLEGVRFMFGHLRANTGCLLADHMGLGKTIQTLATLSLAAGDAKLRKSCKQAIDDPAGSKSRATVSRLKPGDRRIRVRSLVLCPLQVVNVWAAETEKFNRVTTDGRPTTQTARRSGGNSSTQLAEVIPYQLYDVESDTQDAANAPGEKKRQRSDDELQEGTGSQNVTAADTEATARAPALWVHLLVAERTTPNERSAILDHFAAFGGILIMSYSMLRLLPANQLPEPHIAVLDEAHVIKNDDTLIWQRVSMLQTKRRILLSGYPTQNNLAEYYTMLCSAQPSLASTSTQRGGLGSSADFDYFFRTPIEDYVFYDSSIITSSAGDPSWVSRSALDERQRCGRRLLALQRATYLLSLVRGVMLRRGPSVLRTYVPPRRAVILTVRPTRQQLIVAQQLKAVTSVGFGLYAAVVHVLGQPLNGIVQRAEGESRQLLSKLVDDGVLCDTSASSGSTGKEAVKIALDDPVPKLDLTVELTLSAVFGSSERGSRRGARSGRKVLIFMTYLASMDVVAKELQLTAARRYPNGKFSVARIDGGTPMAEREQLAARFNAFDVNSESTSIDVLLYSIRTGGEGICLTGANLVISYECTWNPSLQHQAFARAFRLGQRSPVDLVSLAVDATIEAVVVRTQLKKESLHRWFVEGKVGQLPDCVLATQTSTAGKAADAAAQSTSNGSAIDLEARAKLPVMDFKDEAPQAVVDAVRAALLTTLCDPAGTMSQSAKPTLADCLTASLSSSPLMALYFGRIVQLPENGDTVDDTDPVAVAEGISDAARQALTKAAQQDREWLAAHQGLFKGAGDEGSRQGADGDTVPALRTRSNAKSVKKPMGLPSVEALPNNARQDPWLVRLVTGKVTNSTKEGSERKENGDVEHSVDVDVEFKFDGVPTPRARTPRGQTSERSSQPLESLGECDLDFNF